MSGITNNKLTDETLKACKTEATIWPNNYSGTCVQEYVKLERLQQRHA